MVLKNKYMVNPLVAAGLTTTATAVLVRDLVGRVTKTDIGYVSSIAFYFVVAANYAAIGGVMLTIKQIQYLMEKWEEEEKYWRP